MPYIDQAARDDLNEFLRMAQTSGEFNYIVTTEIVNYVLEKGMAYQTFNDIIGALEGAKMEFYRRVVAPYEDRKIAENGDVYTPILP